MLQEFREFIMRGNVIDLAVGIIIGTAFTSVVNSLVNDVLMPPIGFLIGGVDFSNLAIPLGEEAAIHYGLFINALIQFLIVGFAVFMLVRTVNATVKRFEKRQEEEAEAAPTEPTTDEKLLETLDRLNTTLDRMAS